MLKVARSACYAWLTRGPSQRTLAHTSLTEQIRMIYEQSDSTYGMPRIRAELIEQGWVVSRKRVARLMRTHGLRGVSRRRSAVATTQRKAKQCPVPD